MRRITKKEFEYFFSSFLSLLEKEIDLSVKMKFLEGDNCARAEYDSVLGNLNEYWDAVQDFRPCKYINVWRKREVEFIDNVFDKIEGDLQGDALRAVKRMHGERLITYIDNIAGREFEALRKGKADYVFFKQMQNKGQLRLAEAEG